METLVIATVAVLAGASTMLFIAFAAAATILLVLAVLAGLAGAMNALVDEIGRQLHHGVTPHPRPVI